MTSISTAATNPGAASLPPIRVPLLVPRLPDREALWPYLGRIDEARHYTNFGPLVKELEARLVALFQRHTSYPLYLATVSNATLGIELALLALQLPKGSPILVPALTFVATLTAVIRAGHVPVVADIDLDSWLFTPELATAAVQASGARAVVAVSTFGYAQDTPQWSAFQRAAGIPVVIDAAGAFGSQWIDAPDLTVVYSMHATKSLAAAEGGFVVSGQAATIAQVVQMSNFGINMDKHADIPVGYLSSVGTNAKLSEVHAAIALCSLDTWDQQAAVRHQLYLEYRATLAEVRGPTLRWQAGVVPASPTIFSVRLGSAARRERLEALCAQAGIATRRWYQPLLHRHGAAVQPLVVLPLPQAEQVADDLLGLPFFPGMSAAQIELIAETVYRSGSPD